MSDILEITKNYRNHQSLSQSEIKALIYSEGRVKEEDISDIYYEEKIHFIIGSAIDVLLTSPLEFEQKYYVDRLETKPGATIMSIIKYIYDNYSYSKEDFHEDNLELYNTIVQICNDNSFYTRWKDDTRVSNIISAGKEYFDSLLDSKDKQLLSLEEYNTAASAALAIRSSNLTADYFMNNSVLYQHAIYFTYRDVECKALLDMIIIDEKAKTIQPIDIKSTAEYGTNFDIVSKRFRYDIQAAFYTLALSIEYSDYEILPFKFIVVSIKDLDVFIYTCTDIDLETGRYGATSTIPFSCKNTNSSWYKTNIIHGFEQGLDIHIAKKNGTHIISNDKELGVWE